jgi:hypothetical protein
MKATTNDREQVFLHEGEQLVLKAYASPDGKRLRIVLPSLRSYAQVRHDIEGPVKYLEILLEPPKGAHVVK